MRLHFPTPTALLVGGMPGSGKSHMLDNATFLSPVRVLSADTLRGQVQQERGLPFHAFAKECIPEARNRFFLHLQKSLTRGENVICEAAYLRVRTQMEIGAIAADYGYPLDMILVDSTLRECWKSTRGRARRVPTRDLWDYWGQYKTLVRSIEDDGRPPYLRSLTRVSRDMPFTALSFDD